MHRLYSERSGAPNQSREEAGCPGAPQLVTSERTDGIGWAQKGRVPNAIARGVGLRIAGGTTGGAVKGDEA